MAFSNRRYWRCLKQAEVGQFRGERLGEIFFSLPHIAVRWRIGSSQVAPALKRPMGTPHNGNQLPVQHERVCRRSVPLVRLANIEKLLPDRNLPFDHPIKRTAIEQFFSTLGRPCRDVRKLRLLASLFQVGKPCLLTTRQPLDSIDADTKFDQVQCHDFSKAHGNTNRQPIGISAFFTTKKPEITKKYPT